MALILLLEDDLPIAELIQYHLLRAGHTVELCHDGLTGLKRLRARAFDLVVLDLMLPGKGGLDVCRELRQTPGVQPVVLILTARAQEEELVLGYEVGADDYVKKPFSVRELLARIAGLLRFRDRQSESKPRALEAGPLEVDFASRCVRAGNEELRLTPMEYAMLLYLLLRPGEVVPRERLLNEVWGYTHSGCLRTVDTHVTRVRKKLGGAGADPDMLRTIFGVGYAFEPRADK